MIQRIASLWKLVETAPSWLFLRIFLIALLNNNAKLKPLTIFSRKYLPGWIVRSNPAQQRLCYKTLFDIKLFKEYWLVWFSILFIFLFKYMVFFLAHSP